jgi:GTP-binding protein HflX
LTDSPWTDTSPDTALIIHPVFTNIPVSERGDIDQAVEEACGLAEAIQLKILEPLQVNINRINPGRLFGKGTLEKIVTAVEEQKPDIVVINHTLSPVQQRNLEKATKAKIIDRTGLILEIFGARAQTKEGTIQVELAQLEYQKSRLVKAWSHLERQRGGTSFVGGPGESQLEIDKRLIAERIANLKKELLKVRKTRDLSRKAREKVPFPVVALVGYTNAGKSTLFNRLTGAEVFAEDLLFATLDPTMRRIELPSGRVVILSDTVGFISDLPTHLIEAFRATLDQTQYADVILHVRDSTQTDFDAHKEEVMRIMKDLGIDYENDDRVFEVINKIDICTGARRNEVIRQSKFNDQIIPISAATGEGIEELLQTIDDFLSRNWKELYFDIPPHDGKAIAWLYEHAEVLKTEKEVKIDGENNQDVTRLFVHIDPANQNRFERLFPYAAN